MGSPNWLANQSLGTMSLQFPRTGFATRVGFYEDNSYIRLLNQILQMELGSVELYQNCAACLDQGQASSFRDEHQEQAKVIRNMILSNRGLPSLTGFVFSSELSLFTTKISRHLPEDFARRTTRVSCLQVEKSLRRRYKLALDEAPYRDRSQLTEHVQRIHVHIAQLRLDS